ncbi:hypothetical protein Tco_0702660 [Tanacetum coccineum]|uniref:Reverse transcriptase domain-containing protein n=1 Tax=Tanacetum coccineum TaxID=301880 RepID=A0ABQ4XWM6_9ASTR
METGIHEKFGIVCHEKVVRIPLEDLVHGATSVAKSPYRLAPLEMQELSEQLRELQDKVVDALSRKERVKPRRVRAMAMTIQYGVRGMILAAQSEAFKQENVLAERLHGKEWNSGDDQLRLRWMIYLVVLADAAEKTLEDIMRACVINFGGSYHLTNRCAPFEALYGRKCRSHVLWAEIRESSLTGLELVQETIDKVVLVKENPKVARDRQKSYVDYRRKPSEFEVGNPVLLKVTHWNGIVCFGKKGKISTEICRTV